MNSNNKNQFDEANFSRMSEEEFLVYEKLIEEHEAYEEEFLSMEPSSLDEEFDFIISQYENETDPQDLESVYCEIFETDDELLCPLEDFLLEISDEKLIRERLEYESSNPVIVDNFASNDFYEPQISAMVGEEFFERNCYDYDAEYEPDYEIYCEPDYEYDAYEEEMFYHLQYLKESQFASQSTCGCDYLDYMPHDDGLFDCMECYDYPEGPDENLNGVKFY